MNLTSILATLEVENLDYAIHVLYLFAIGHGIR